MNRGPLAAKNRLTGQIAPAGDKLLLKMPLSEFAHYLSRVGQQRVAMSRAIVQVAEGNALWGAVGAVQQPVGGPGGQIRNRS